MSWKRLPKQWGIVIRCDGTDTTECDEKIQTGNIVVKHNRAYAAGQGWGRGLRPGRKSRDHCPTHMEAEREAFAKYKREARKKELDEKRKAKWSAEPKPKKPRKKKGAATSSPSAASAPAPST